MKTIELPPGTIVESAEYWYFLTELLVVLRKDCAITDERMTEAFAASGFTPEEIQATFRYLGEGWELEDLAFRLFDLLERRKMEALIGTILTSHGYSHSTPDTRARMGKKMFDSIKTPLIERDQVVKFVEQLGTNLIYILIEEE
jgi:hypothetical protein